MPLNSGFCEYYFNNYNSALHLRNEEAVGKSCRATPVQSHGNFNFITGPNCVVLATHSYDMFHLF
jgi:hypothetical protein